MNQNRAGEGWDKIPVVFRTFSEDHVAMDSSVDIVWREAFMKVLGVNGRDGSLESEYTGLSWGLRDSPRRLDACGNGPQQGAPPSLASASSVFVCFMVCTCALVCSDDDCF